MSTLQEKLNALKTRFIKSLPDRFGAMESALRKLGEGEATAIIELERGFHSLVGTAGTYGLAAMSASASEGERLCAELEVVSAADFLALESALARVRATLEEHRPSPIAAGPFGIAVAHVQGKVLCVEDDPDQAAYLCEILQAAGYETAVASDASSFDAAVVDFRPDLVLLDINLGDGCGLELARRMRVADGKTTMPIVFVTARSSIEARIDGIRAGGDDFLVKPVLPQLLLTTVAIRLERSKALRSLMDHDELTKVSTQGAFSRKMELAIADHSRHKTPVCLVMLDIDHFKNVNDTHGHVIGDRVLTSFARVLRANVRESDVVGRCGGEEFGIVLPGMLLADAQRLTERLLARFAGVPHAGRGGARFFVTFSAGVATLDDRDDVTSWKQRADDALYSAKRGGRARVAAA